LAAPFLSFHKIHICLRPSIPYRLLYKINSLKTAFEASFVLGERPRETAKSVGIFVGIKPTEARFARYVEGLVSLIEHADRAGPLRDYVLGLVLPGDRKSVESMAAITAPERTPAQHPSLLHFVGAGGWSDTAVLGKVCEMVLAKIDMVD